MRIPQLFTRLRAFAGSHRWLPAIMTCAAVAIAASAATGWLRATDVSAIGDGIGEALVTPGRARGIADFADVVSVAAERLTPIREATLATDIRRVRAKPGDTVMKLLVGAGAPRGDAHRAILAMRKFYDPKNLMPGQEFRLTLASADMGMGHKGAGKDVLFGLKFRPEIDRDIVLLRREDGNFLADEIKRPLTREMVRVAATLDSSLYAAGERAGMPARILVEMIRAFSFDVDFQREIQPADRFEAMFEHLVTENGEVVRVGKIIHATLVLGGTALKIYRFQPEGGHADYFDEKGQSVRKALLRTPINGARLSSRFGRRRHPILGYTRMHRGVDFAAPKGTPVMAAGKGVVIARGYNRGHGRYVKIRHNSEYTTLYGHLHRYARDGAKGKRVKQGQVIGYVGSTGLSTGAHLHYEVARFGRIINPLRVKLPAGPKLRGKTLAAFQAARADIDKQLAALKTQTRIARRETD